MKREKEKSIVISLSDESFKHYLIERYGNQSESNVAADLKEANEESISADTWVKLYRTAKQDLERVGGRITGYEVVNDELVSHEGIRSYWPAHWMWVMQFRSN
jgi:hypothetical protein